jgi:hypothetical protein
MTTNYTMFLNLLVQAFPDYVGDIDTSTYAAQLDDQVRYNIQDIVVVQDVVLGLNATYTLPITNLSTGWYLIAITCAGSPVVTTPATIIAAPAAGQGYITTSENNAAAAPITGTIPIYGVSMPSGVTFPGIVFLSTQGMTAKPVITSLLANSVFNVFIATCVEDGG